MQPFVRVDIATTPSAYRITNLSVIGSKVDEWRIAKDVGGRSLV